MSGNGVSNVEGFGSGTHDAYLIRVMEKDSKGQWNEMDKEGGFEG